MGNDEDSPSDGLSHNPHITDPCGLFVGASVPVCGETFGGAARPAVVVQPRVLVFFRHSSQCRRGPPPLGASPYSHYRNN